MLPGARQAGERSWQILHQSHQLRGLWRSDLSNNFSARVDSAALSAWGSAQMYSGSRCPILSRTESQMSAVPLAALFGKNLDAEYTSSWAAGWGGGARGGQASINRVGDLA